MSEAKRLSEAYMFRHKIKPTLLVNYMRRGKDKSFIGETILFNEFKDSNPYIIFELRNSVLFFQSLSEKEKFLQEGCLYIKHPTTGERMLDFKHDKIGLALGYPPSAVEFFVSKVLRGTPEKVKINYYGISFVCSPTDVDNCIKWMDENIKIPDYIRIISRVFIEGSK